MSFVRGEIAHVVAPSSRIKRRACGGSRLYCFLWSREPLPPLTTTSDAITCLSYLHLARLVISLPIRHALRREGPSYIKWKMHVRLFCVKHKEWTMEIKTERYTWKERNTSPWYARARLALIHTKTDTQLRLRRDKKNNLQRKINEENEERKKESKKWRKMEKN